MLGCGSDTGVVGQRCVHAPPARLQSDAQRPPCLHCVLTQMPHPTPPHPTPLPVTLSSPSPTPRLDKYVERSRCSPDGLLGGDDLDDLVHELGHQCLAHPLAELRNRWGGVWERGWGGDKVGRCEGDGMAG